MTRLLARWALGLTLLQAPGLAHGGERTAPDAALAWQRAQSLRGGGIALTGLSMGATLAGGILALTAAPGQAGDGQRTNAWFALGVGAPMLLAGIPMWIVGHTRAQAIRKRHAMKVVPVLGPTPGVAVHMRW